MKEDIKAEWIKRLRSGEYKQCSGALTRVRKSDGDTRHYCCLGVLTVMAKERGVVREFRYSDDTDVSEITYYVEDEEHGAPLRDADGNLISEHAMGIEQGGLPYAVQEWAGIDSRLGDFKLPTDRNASLAALNDGGASFPEIANIIEEHF